MILKPEARQGCLLVLLLATSSARAQTPSPVARYAARDQLTAIAGNFERQVQSARFQITVPIPTIVLDTSPQLSKYTRQDNTIHTSRWEELAPDAQDLFTRWAGYAGDRTGKQLFDEMFYRFFFVHELAHWLQIQAADDTNDVYEHELEANRITVAYWRENDPRYLDEIVQRFRRINAALPNPVPPGQHADAYFNSNYRGLGSNPQVYGWFQTDMVIRAISEQPARTFTDIVQRMSRR